MRKSILMGGALPAGSLVLVGCFGSSNSSSDGGAYFDTGIPEVYVLADGDVLPDVSITDAGLPSGNFSTTPIDFGEAGCGTTPTATQTYKMLNTGPVAVTYSATVSTGFSITGSSSGMVAPNGSATLTLGAAMIPPTANAGVPITGTLVITTNIPGIESVTVPLSITPMGGSLVANPLGFGTVQVLSQFGPLGVSIQNVGNAPVNVTFGAPTDPEFGFTYTGSPASAAIMPGTSLAGASATFTPSGAGAKSATVAIQTTDTLCASADSSFTLSGTGTTAPVTIGPSPVSFGAVLCGSVGSPQVVTIKNGYSSPITYTASLASATSPYSLSATSGTVMANATTTITVTPAPIPFPGNMAPGAYDDTLTISTTVPGASPVAIPLTQQPSGAVLSLTMASTSFGVDMNTTASLPFTVGNSGTLNALVGLNATGAGFAAAFTGSNFATSNGGSEPGTVTFTPAANSAASGALALTTSAPLCAALPSLNLTATGDVPVASFPSGTINLTYCEEFAQYCGGDGRRARRPSLSPEQFSCTPSQATLSIENTGKAPLLISGVSSENGLFNILSVPTTAIAPGTAATIVIQAIDNIDVCCDDDGDTLSFTTNEPGDPTDSVMILDVVGVCIHNCG
jgi:hypothetical protein